MCVDFKCNLLFFVNDYNYFWVYWNMKFGLYLFNDSVNIVYYKFFEEEICDKRGDLLFLRIFRSLRRFFFNERIFGEDIMVFFVEDIRLLLRGLIFLRNIVLIENILFF